jgi:hypothetical protein
MKFANVRVAGKIIQRLDEPRFIDLYASSDGAHRIIPDLGGLILIKPRSQLAVRTYTKGIIIDAIARDGRREYDRMLRQVSHDHSFARQFPETMLPMLQRYHPEAMDVVLSLSGFRDVSGSHVVMLGAHKVL